MNDKNKLIEALYLVQNSLTGVVRDSSNPHFKNRYASLEAVIDTLRPALQANSLVVTQAPGRITPEGCIEITTTIWHINGESLVNHLHIPLSKRDAQGAGSAITYGCRYSLMALFCIPPVDDDGEASIERNFPKSQTQSTKSSNSIKKDQPNRWSEVEAAIRATQTKDQLKEYKKSIVEEVSTWPLAWRDALTEQYEVQLDSFMLKGDF